MGLDNPLHIAFLVLILLLVFGAKRIPEIARSLGSGMNEFKQAVTGQQTQPLQPGQQPVQQQPVAQATAVQQPVAQAAPPPPPPMEPVVAAQPAEVARPVEPAS